MTTAANNSSDAVADVQHSSMIHRYRWGIAVLVSLGFFMAFPPFYVVSLHDAQEQLVAKAFNAKTYVEEFWQVRLLGAVEQAIDIVELKTALQEDSAATVERLGHRLGLGSLTAYFLVRGLGVVTSVEDGIVGIALQDGGRSEVVIDTGPVFGNAIREASGLLNISEFANGQDFNALSSELNRRVEEMVLPRLANIGVGRTVRFAGAVELPDISEVPVALRLVPVVIEFL
ncbi:MAG: DUF2291 domain-containing protein [Myxococcales bacterium]|nr:DUF2291 domain-containing protein [Myxococcales bacterium]